MLGLGLLNPFNWIRRIFTLLLLIAIFFPAYFAYSIWNEAHNAHPVKSDVIVVLGAAQYNGKPSDILQARIDAAAAAYKAGFAKKIITVGSNAKGDNFTEASTSYRALIEQKISKSALAYLGIGRDTLSSTLAYAGYAKKNNLTSVIIATDPYHCYRAEAEAKDLGLYASCAPSVTGPASIGEANWRYILRETGAYLSYKTLAQFGIHLTDQVKN